MRMSNGAWKFVCSFNSKENIFQAVHIPVGYIRHNMDACFCKRIFASFSYIISFLFFEYDISLNIKYHQCVSNITHSNGFFDVSCDFYFRFSNVSSHYIFQLKLKIHCVPHDFLVSELMVQYDVDTRWYWYGCVDISE